MTLIFATQEIAAIAFDAGRALGVEEERKRVREEMVDGMSQETYDELSARAVTVLNDDRQNMADNILAMSNRGASTIAFDAGVEEERKRVRAEIMRMVKRYAGYSVPMLEAGGLKVLLAWLSAPEPTKTEER